MEVITVDQFKERYGDPAKAVGRKRSLRGQVRRKHVAGPNATERRIYNAVIAPMVLTGEALRVYHGDEFGKIRLCRRVSYRPDWVVDRADGFRLYIECKSRWKNAKKKDFSTWRTRETLVKLCWLAMKEKRKGGQVWLLTVELDKSISRESIEP